MEFSFRKLPEEIKLQKYSESSGRTLADLRLDFQQTLEEFPSPELPPSDICQPQFITVLKSLRSKNLFKEAVAKLPRYYSSTDPGSNEHKTILRCKLCPIDSPFLTTFSKTLRAHELVMHKELDDTSKLYRKGYRRNPKIYIEVKTNRCPTCHRRFNSISRARDHWSRLCGQGWICDEDCTACCRLSSITRPGSRRQCLPKHTCGWKPPVRVLKPALLKAKSQRLKGFVLPVPTLAAIKSKRRIIK